MSNKWPITTIGELAADDDGAIAIGPFGSSMKADVYTETGIPVVRGNNLNGQPGFFGDFVFVPKEVADRFARCLVRPGDLVFPHRGAIGEVGLVTTQAYDEWMISTSMMKLRPHPEKLDPRFAFYYFRSPSGRHQLLRNASQVGTPGISQPLTSLRACEIKLPPLWEQRAIVEVLRTLDDKIEQNRRTGRALEALARATFKAWFVDFEPVKAKAAGATSFPGMAPAVFAAFPDWLTDSELGQVPQGWHVKKAGDLASFILGGDWGKDAPSNEHPEAAYCIRGADIPDLWANGIGKMPVRFLKRSSLEKRSLQNGDIVIEISGGSPTQSTGRPVLVSDALLGELPYPLVYSNFCRLFRPMPHLSNYTYFLFRWMYDTEQFLQYENGTTGIKNFAFTKFCEVHAVIEPPAATLTGFDKVVNPLMELMAHQGSESRKLAALRDYLLPRLLSGRVRVRPSQVEAAP